MRPTFGKDAPCRFCHGAGERVLAMTEAEKRERSREQRRAHREGYELERAPITKPCPDCAGYGYVPFQVADGTRQWPAK